MPKEQETATVYLNIPVSKDNTIEHLQEIFANKDHVVLTALPSISRVQYALGNAENWL